MTALLHLAGHTTQTLASPEGVRIQLQNYFDNLWDEQRKVSKKLSYYNQVKKPPKIEFEPYLNLKDERERKSLMRLRSSSHRLNCETARYITNDELTKRQQTPSWLKRCEFCTAEDALSLTHLPFSNIIEEDEQHVLIACPRFHEYRLNLQEQTKSRPKYGTVLVVQLNPTRDLLNFPPHFDTSDISFLCRPEYYLHHGVIEHKCK